MGLVAGEGCGGLAADSGGQRSGAATHGGQHRGAASCQLPLQVLCMGWVAGEGCGGLAADSGGKCSGAATHGGQRRGAATCQLTLQVLWMGWLAGGEGWGGLLCHPQRQHSFPCRQCHEQQHTVWICTTHMHAPGRKAGCMHGKGRLTFGCALCLDHQPPSKCNASCIY